MEGGVDKLDSVQEVERVQGETLNALREFSFNSRENVGDTFPITDEPTQVAEVCDRGNLCTSV